MNTDNWVRDLTVTLRGGYKPQEHGSFLLYLIARALLRILVRGRYVSDSEQLP